MPRRPSLNSAYRLVKPCSNCPFNKEGAIELHPGRLEEIIERAMSDDGSHFQCHKTLESKKGVSICAGSMIYLLKADNPNVMMRCGAAMKLLDYDELRKHSDAVIDPLT